MATFAGLCFAPVCVLEPLRGGDGRVLTYVPESAICNTDRLRLHAYGVGPFCRFRIPDSWRGRAGVYVVTVDSAVAYVGECVDLRQRFNVGYGSIQPRNRFDGGQPTNCRLNRLVLESVNGGHLVELWFHETGERKRVEQRIGSTLKPPWNRTFSKA